MYKIPLIKPYITDETKQRVLDVLESGYLTEGPVTLEFEKCIAKYCGTAHCIAVTSCTTGLELALRALGIGNGDEVIVPDYTYPATAAVVNIVGAKAVIVDIDPETMLIDYNALETAITEKTRAVIPVSLFGSPLNWERLKAIQARHRLFIIEDAACALGSSYRDKKTGAWADITVFSHHPRKFITTGEGGTVTTDNSEWADWMKSYKHFGMGVNESRSTTEFVRIGTNYKLSNVLAAIGLAQMAHLDDLMAERRCLAQSYHNLFYGNSRVRLPRITEKGDPSWQTFCVFVEERDRVMEALRKTGIEAQIGTYSLHMHPAFAKNHRCRLQGSVKGSQYAYRHALALPMYHGMTNVEQEKVAETLNKEVAG